ncbi:PLDc N-terminal domain-containing protein [Alkalihalophilus lindianensis]|uniref:PLDc N-terminal domain-containing protein n=1 Tax=Alkalihalophilus lindianensis TaxID=1630542 RepID=A0ABU3X970_9BACI|nr:PLDc N-terminal domain-containing protein [Alkalihalophilus lindianensis]MDV2684442.1 PLDc N-terminal domain-containing protein [Alkalihalophilus lindianensis]
MELLIWPIVFFLLIFGGFILNVITSIWCYRDSIRSGNSKEYSLLILVATLFFPVIGFIVYLFIRK